MTKRKPKDEAAPEEGVVETTEKEASEAPETPTNKEPVRSIHERGIVSIDY